MKYVTSFLVLFLASSGSEAMHGDGAGAAAAPMAKGVGLGQVRSVQQILASLQTSTGVLRNANESSANRDTAYLNIIGDIRNLFDVEGKRFRHDVANKAQAITLIERALVCVKGVISAKDQPYDLGVNIYRGGKPSLRTRELGELWAILLMMPEDGLSAEEIHLLHESAQILQFLGAKVGFPMRLIDGIPYYAGSVLAAAGQGAAVAAAPRHDVTAIDKPRNLGVVRTVPELLEELTTGEAKLKNSAAPTASRDGGYMEIIGAARNLFNVDGTRFRYEITQDPALKVRAINDLTNAFRAVLYELKQSGRAAARYPLLTRLMQSPLFPNRIAEVKNLSNILKKLAYPEGGVGDEALRELFRQTTEMLKIIDPPAYV